MHEVSTSGVTEMVSSLIEVGCACSLCEAEHKSLRLSQCTGVHLPVLPSLLLTCKPVGAHMNVELFKEANLTV